MPPSSMPQGPRVLLAGVTGMVGSALWHRWSSLQRGSSAVLLRREWKCAGQAAVQILADDPLGWSEALLDRQLAAFAPQAFVCCVGTTLRRAGSRREFERVDRDLVLQLARAAQRHGASRVLLVSSVGADPQARGFYLQVKGRLERDLIDMGFEGLDLLRPGLLIGARNESRPIEALAQRCLPRLNPLLRGALQRYRAISADQVAAALNALLQQPAQGVRVHEYAALMALQD